MNELEKSEVHCSKGAGASERIAVPSKQRYDVCSRESKMFQRNAGKCTRKLCIKELETLFMSLQTPRRSLDQLVAVKMFCSIAVTVKGN